MVAASLVILILFIQATTPMIDPSKYMPLLNTIAKGESNGNYNAYFGNTHNSELQFTKMTIAEVMRWQEAYIRQGKASNAVGRYQFMGTTLAGLIRQLHINPQVTFNEALQDRLAIALIERRGSLAFVQKQITLEQFAANLAMEWAALPRVIGGSSQESYYAGDGLNQARVSTDEVFKAIGKLDGS
jgi:conjugal transfer mating pair stabilization protein TraG